jgi:hypothetical protein
MYPKLWMCSGCEYSYWSNGPSQDPTDDGHCSNGIWLCDKAVIWFRREEHPLPISMGGPRNARNL